MLLTFSFEIRNLRACQKQEDLFFFNLLTQRPGTRSARLTCTGENMCSCCRQAMALAWTRQSWLACMTPQATRQLERRADMAAPSSDRKHRPQSETSSSSVVLQSRLLIISWPWLYYPADLDPDRWWGHAGSGPGCCGLQDVSVEQKEAASAPEWKRAQHEPDKGHRTGPWPGKDCGETRSAKPKRQLSRVRLCSILVNPE